MARRSTIQPLGDARGALPYRDGGNHGQGSTSLYESSANLLNAAPHAQPQDVASLLGISARLVTPRMLESVGKLLDNQQILRQLREQAEHQIEWLEQELDRDVVAQCLNRRGFLREITLFLRSADVYGVLVLLQVRGLESVQSHFGLRAVEHLIHALAGRLQESVRVSDLVGYLGYGNFAALLTATDTDRSERKIDRLGPDLLTPPLLWHNQECALEIHCGAYTLTPDDTTESALTAVDYTLRGIPLQEVVTNADGWEEGFFADLVEPTPPETVKPLDSKA